MKPQLYTTSKKAWDAMLKSIEKAEKSVYIEMYIFETDTSESHDFLGILKQKSSEGVRVVIVADAFGSKPLQKEAGDLRKAGIELYFFSHWLRHIHRKILIIDEQTVFIGGVNIGKRFENWDDLHLRMGGKIVKRILKSFAYTYEMAGGKDGSILLWRKKRFSYKLRFWLVEHLPSRNIYTLRRHYTERIINAQKSIRIVTPYFAPPRWLISLLDDAVRRGVLVEILVPQKSDLPLLDRINLYYMEKLHTTGTKFFQMRKMNHAKLLVINDEEALVGSQNFDLLSFEVNTEAGIFFKDKALIKKIAETYAFWKDGSIEFAPGQYKKRLTDYAIALLVKIFRPIL